MKCKQIAIVTFLFISLFWGVLGTVKVNGQSSSVILENTSFRYSISRDGKNQNFIDKQTGIDYCDHQKDSYCARIKKGEKEYIVSSVSSNNNLITMNFTEAQVSAVLEKTVHDEYIELEIVSVQGEGVDSFVFIDLPLTLKGRPEEPFAACGLALNIFTRVDQLPALQTNLSATCYKKFNLNGAKIALIGVPQSRILEVLKNIIITAKDLPKSTVSGPWAQEIPFNHGSYLFNFGDLTEDNVGEWIEMVKSLGFNQIDSHGGGERFFRFGDFHLNEKKWPKGWENYKNINKRLHEAGIGSILHTYCHYIDKRSKYVTPIPSQQLDAYKSFTLAKSLGPQDTEIQVEESTADISTITGFFVNNSVTLHIGNELITFTSATKKSPYIFTGCTRGACGTKISAHQKGENARHLKEILGLFVPLIESDLYKEILRTHADIVNYCDFDGLYFDGIGADVMLGSSEDLWYYDTKFLYDIWKDLKKPVGMEYSSMFHHWWQFRSRWQAWDYPSRGHKRFIDLHVESVNGGLLLPLQLGCWNFHAWDPPQVEPTFPDVVEYMGCKLIGYNAGLSMTTKVDKETMRSTPAFKRNADILKKYEELRHTNYFGESIKKELREPGKEFNLFCGSDGRWKFRRAQYDVHKVEGLSHQSSAWIIKNLYANQPVKMRIEALMSVGSYDAPENVTLADFTTEHDFPRRLSADGVMLGIESTQDQVKVGTKSGCFNALNSGTVDQKGSWTMAVKTFEPWLNLNNQQALGVWIYGDGQGELINFRIKSPEHIAYGSIADHYIMVDFTGWRYFELIETESIRHTGYTWPEGQALYHVYREIVDYKNIETLGVWYNNLPPNKKVTCYISPVKALPMVSVKIKNPAVNINGKTIVFPVEMESGSYLELNSMTDCKLYGSKGELITEVTLTGDVPTLNTGSNEISFTCDKQTNLSIRAMVTLISHGEELQ